MSLWSPNMFYEVNVTYCFQDCFWLSDYETDTDYKVVLFLLTRCLVMFILCCNCINVEMIRSRLLNGGAPAIWHSTLNSAKTTFIVWILQYNEQHLKSETLFRIKSTKAQCLLRFTGWKLCFNVRSIDWKLAPLIDSWDLRIDIVCKNENRFILRYGYFLPSPSWQCNG